MRQNNSIETIISMVLHDKQLFHEVSFRIKDNIFSEDIYNEFMKHLRKFFQSNKRCPTIDEFKVFIGDKTFLRFDFAEKVFNTIPNVNVEFIRKEIYKSYQIQQTLKLINSFEDKIDSNKLEISDAYADMRKMVQRTIEPERGYVELGSDNIEHLYIEARDSRVDTASPLVFKNITLMAAGGLARRELLILIAPPNRGKTTYLINELHMGLIRNEKVLYISMEEEKDSIIGRLSDRILLMTKKQQRLKEKYCATRIKRFFKMTKGPVIIYRPANTFAVQDLELFIDEYELRHDIKFDRVIIDYMNKMKKSKVPAGSAVGESERILTDDLRALAIAKNTRAITAAQTNRSGIVNREGTSTESTSETMIQGGFGQFETADIVLGFSETPAEKQRGGGRIGILKMRSAGGRGREFIITMAPWIGLITDDPDSIIHPDHRNILGNPDRDMGELQGLPIAPPPPKPKKKKPNKDSKDGST